MTEVNNNNVPKALRNWFVVHFIADMLFAIPLFFFPEFFLKLMGWKAIDPITTRLVAAALFGIGIESLLSYKSGMEAYRGMLNLKIIWSFSAMVGLLVAVIQGLYTHLLIGWSFFAVFFLFNILWVYWRIRIRGMTG